MKDLTKCGGWPDDGAADCSRTSTRLLVCIEAAPKPLVDALRSSVPKGASAIVLLAARMHVDATLSALGDADGAVFRRTLTAEQATALRTSVNGAPMAPAGPFEEKQDAAPPA